jgi:hypothetical protein
MKEYEQESDMLDLCSYRATRRILKYHWFGEIPDYTIRESQTLFNNVLNALAEAIVQNHISHNEKLKKYHLRPKLRLSLNKNLSDIVYKALADFNLGTTGESNRHTVESYKQDVEVN